MARLSLIVATVVTLAICGIQAQREPVMSCDFDEGLCRGWKNDRKQDYRWEIASEAPKPVGPKFDYNRGNAEGSFLYLDDTGGKFASRGIIRTPFMDLTGHDEHCLRFVYFSRGRAPGEFRINHSHKKSGRLVSLFYKIGTQSKNDTHWIFEDVTIPKFESDQPFDKVFFNFQAIRGLTSDNVVAIDDVSVTPGSCPKFQFAKTATTATFSPEFLVTAAAGGGGGEELSNEEVMKRNKELIEANEKRNRELEEHNRRLNSGQPNTTQDTNQPTQPVQPTQPHNNEEKLREEREKLKAAEEKRMKEERERLEREEKERKEAIERKRKEQEETRRKQKEEQDRRNRELQEKQEQERLRKEKEEKKRKELEEKRKREKEEREAAQRAERDRKLREEKERHQREEEERKRQQEEERKRKHQEDVERAEKEASKKTRRGKGRRRQGRGKKPTKDSRASDPKYTQCGDTFILKKKQLCCNGMARKKSKTASGCCGTITMNVKRNGCCGNQIYGLSDPSKQCCGTSFFDSTRRACCGTNMYDIRGTTQCCGSELYDANGSACCGTTVYVMATHDCIDGVVVPK